MAGPDAGVPLPALMTLLYEVAVGGTTPVPVTWEWITAQATRCGARWGVTPDDFERIGGTTVKQAPFAVCDLRRDWPA